MLLDGDIGRHAYVELVKCRLAQKHHQLKPLRLIQPIGDFQVAHVAGEREDLRIAISAFLDFGSANDFLPFNHWIELFHTTAKNLIATPMITALDDAHPDQRNLDRKKTTARSCKLVSGSKKITSVPQIRTRW